MWKTESLTISQTRPERSAGSNAPSVITAVTSRKLDTVNLKTRLCKDAPVPFCLFGQTKTLIATHAQTPLGAGTTSH